MGPDVQSSSRHVRYDQRVQRVLDSLPVLDCHCLCLLWRLFPKPLISQMVGVSEGEVQAALDRAVSALVRALS